MRTLRNRFKTVTITAFAALAFMAARRVDACVNDIDCPEPACGGQICDWLHDGLTCQPAGRYPKGQDGWCMQDSDCKCNGVGAKCIMQTNGTYFCTFVLPSQAPGASTGGASGTGGASTGTGGASTGTGGASTGTGGASTGSDAGTKPSASSGSGGCSLGGTPATSGVAALVVLAGLMAFRRRQRRA
jgi:MYXO-CTERM domain-containing protein